MSIFKNVAGLFMPHHESRIATGSLAANGAELVLDVSGDNACSIYLDGGGGTLNATYEISVSIDGTNYLPHCSYPMPNGCTGGTIPMAGVPIVSEAVNTAGLKRALVVGCGQIEKIRIRFTAWTAGTATVTMVSDERNALNPFVEAQKASTHCIPATGVVSAAVTATLPAAVGLRHYINRIHINRSATAALTASATPVLVTTTNLPGAPVFTFGSDAGGIGIDKIIDSDFGDVGLSATAIGTATTIVAPVYTGVIWRMNIWYRLGL